MFYVPIFNYSTIWADFLRPWVFFQGEVIVRMDEDQS